MLALTENASTIVKQLVEQPEVDVTGLRISGSLASELEVSAALQAEEDDQVVEQDGATVFLDAEAAADLADKVLDAGVDESGNVQFGLSQQA